MNTLDAYRSLAGEMGNYASALSLLGWLRENVHRYGGMYEPQELIERITGKNLDSAHFVRYVKAKYSAIYGM